MSQKSLSEKRALLAKLLQRKSYSFPLSHGQQALWFIYQNAPDSSAYNIAWFVELQGNLKLAALKQALQVLVNRHPALRTTIDIVDGEPLQTVHPTGAYQFNYLQTVDFSKQELESAIKTAYKQPFDLIRGPVLRADIFQTAPQLHIFILTMHHALGDDNSMDILSRELLTIYHAELSGQKLVLPTMPSTYADFVRDEIAMLNDSAGEDLLQYWQHRLGTETHILKLPTDYPRPAVQTYNGSSVPFYLSAKLSQQIKQLAQQKTVTLYILLLTAFQILLHRYTGQTEIWIGTPSSISRRNPKLANLVGYFANTVVLRTTLDSDNLSFHDILLTNKKNVFEAIEHSAYPFILLVKTIQTKRDASYSPLFQVVFDFKPSESLPETIGDLSVSPFEFSQMEGQFDLGLHIVAEEQLSCRLHYNSDLFSVETIERMVGHLQVLLTAVVDNPDRPIAQIPFLTEKEILQLQTLRDTATDYIADQPTVNPANAQLYILDVNHQLVPIGVPGQLCLGGIEPSHDDLNRSEFTADRFVEVELFGKTERIFQTGDFAKWRSDGNIEPVVDDHKESSEPETRKTRYLYPRDEIEFRLVKLWEEFFDISPISVLDDFFKIGGDSLLGIRLIFSIQKTFGTSVQLQTLFQNKTPEQLACVIRGDYVSPAWSPLVCLQSRGEKAPLFIVHASGGTAFDFVEISMLMGDERPFYAIQPKGIEMGDAFHGTIEEMAADYVTAVRSVQKTGPYLFAGWSFGASVAFEMARILEEAGETISLLIMIDAPAPTADVCKEDDFEFLMDRIPHFYGANLEDLDLEESTEEKVAYLLKEVKVTGIFTPDIDQDYSHHWLDMYKHHNRIVATYTPDGPIDSDIVFLKPSEKIPFDEQMGNPSVAWQPFTRGQYVIIDGPGNHFSMVSPLHFETLVNQIKECLKEYLDE